jgi:hypothetical protein
MNGRVYQSLLFVMAHVTLLALGSGCSSGDDDRVEKLLSLAPELQVESARHLVLSDDSTLFDYAHQIGYPVFAGQYPYLKSRIDCTSLESYIASTAVLFPAMKRVESVTAHVFRADKEPRHTPLFTMAPERGLNAARLLEDRSSVVNNAGYSYEDKISRLEAIVGTLEDYGLSGDVGVTLTIIAEIAGREGDVETFLEYSHLALHRARRDRRNRMSCQIMGMVGSYHKRTGNIDSMHVYWDGGLELARRAGLVNQEARLLTFYATYYTECGRMAIAQDHHNMAMDIVREGHTGRMGLRYIVDGLEFHADLGAWEIVGRNLPRAKRLDYAPGYVGKPYESLHSAALRAVEARYLMASGCVEEANGVFATCRDQLRGTMYTEHYVRVLDHWADGLLQNHQAGAAVPVIEEGLRITRDTKPPGPYCRFLIMRARAALELGDLQKADSILAAFEAHEDFDDDEFRQERIASAVLRARMQRQLGDTDGVPAQLETAASRFAAGVRQVDASVHGYLWIGRCDELRRELHLAAGGDPKLGYGIELFWRGAFSLLGADGRHGSSAGMANLAFASGGDSEKDEKLFDSLEAFADRASRAVARLGGTHCEYLVVGDEVWRWTCSRGVVRRDVLDIRAGDLEEVAERAWSGMSQDPGAAPAPPGAGLVEDLRALARALLPPEVVGSRARERPPLLLVTADGFIGRLPFETFNVADAGDYLPLVSVFDVAYLRHVRELTSDAAGSAGLVVASGFSGRARQNICSAPLTEVFVEGKRVVDLYPGAELLINEAATKANILSRWQEASFLYLATHLLEDPDVPYMVLVPLVADGVTGAPSMYYLDMADVRSADFSACKTVVLDQCSSGKPYVGARNTSPGLASAFLDAGAAAVIQTFWNVRDEDAAKFMAMIAGDLEKSPVALVRALCGAKRAYLNAEWGVRHPFSWAAYAVQLGGL